MEEQKINIDETNIKTVGMDSLVVMCRVLNLSFTVAYAYKRHKVNVERCTVALGGFKRFKAVGKNSMEDAIKKAILYLVETYSVFDNLKSLINELDIEANSKCKIISVESIVPNKIS